MGAPDVIKGGFTYTVAGKSLTIAAKGVTKVRFKKVGVGSFGDWVILDLTGKSWVFNFDTQFNAAGCGITETVSWANAMPWTDYLVNLDNDKDNVVAGMSRNPCASVTPAAANIHYNDSVSATEAQTNFMLAIAAGTDYAAAPCVAIGSHTMTYDTADDDWTPGTIAATDGFGKFQEGVQFTYPTAQNTAETVGGTATYLYVTGAGGAADVPVWASNQGTYFYTIERSGVLRGYFSTTGSGNCTNGDQASALYLTLPLAPVAAPFVEMSNLYMIANTTPARGGFLGNGTAGVPRLQLYGESLGAVSANSFANANDDIAVAYAIRAF